LRAWYIREQRHLCGPDYMEADLYEIAPTEHKACRRKKREQATSLAQMAYNNMQAGRYFVQLVATNVTSDWVHLSLTYDNDHHPAPDDEAAVDRDLANYLRRCARHAKKKLDAPLQWLAVVGYAMRTDGGKPGRHHIHLLIGPCGLSRDELEALWGKGYTHSDRVQLDHGSAEGLARYLLHHKYKKRRWRQSRGLEKPKRPAPNDTKWSRKRFDEAGTLYVDDRAFWEKQYPGYTLNRCEIHITGSGTKHLVVKLRRKDWGKPALKPRRRMKNQP